jgi:WS/DGAT/MGAT family acyltransferase
MKRLSLMDMAFFVAESEDSPKHVAGLMLCQKPKGCADDYVERLIEDACREDRISEPFDQVIHFFGPLGPYWDRCRAFSFDNHVFYHHEGRAISWNQAMQKAALLHEPMLDRSRPLWEFHLIDGIRGRRFALYLKLHHAYADGMTMTSWMDQGLATCADDDSFTPPWAINPRKRRSRRRENAPRRPSLPRPSQVLCGLAGMAKQQLRSGGGMLKLTAQQAIERAGLTQDAVALMFSTPPDTPMTGSAKPGRSVATAGVPMSRVFRLCDATCSTLNHVALACIDGAIHDYLARRDIHLEHPLSVQMPVNLRDADAGQGGGGNRIGITLVDLAQPGLSPYRRLREIGFKLHNVKYQVSGIPAVAFEQFTFLAGGASEAINKLGLTDSLPTNGHAVVSNLPGPKETRYLRGSLVERMYPISTLSPGLRLNITMFSYDGILHFGLVATRDLDELQSLADGIVEQFRDLEKAIRQRR